MGTNDANEPGDKRGNGTRVWRWTQANIEADLRHGNSQSMPKPDYDFK